MTRRQQVIRDILAESNIRQIATAVDADRDAELIERELLRAIVKEDIEDYTYTTRVGKDRLIAVAVTHPKLRRHILMKYGRYLLPPPSRLGRYATWPNHIERILANWKTFDEMEDVLIAGRAGCIAEKKDETGACQVLAKERSGNRCRKNDEDSANGIRKAYYEHRKLKCFYPACSRWTPTRRGRHPLTRAPQLPDTKIRSESKMELYPPFPPFVGTV
jgi:hypothetical protein